MRCGWYSTAKGTMPWQLCSASVKPAGIIQVFFEKSKTIPKNSIKFKAEVILLKYAAKLTVLVVIQYIQASHIYLQMLFSLRHL